MGGGLQHKRVLDERLFRNIIYLVVKLTYNLCWGGITAFLLHEPHT